MVSIETPMDAHLLPLQHQLNLELYFELHLFLLSNLSLKDHLRSFVLLRKVEDSQILTMSLVSMKSYGLSKREKKTEALTGKCATDLLLHAQLSSNPRLYQTPREQPDEQFIQELDVCMQDSYKEGNKEQMKGQHQVD